MIILTSTYYPDRIEYSATKGNVTFVSGDSVEITVLNDEKVLKELHPESPDWNEPIGKMQSIFWEVIREYPYSNEK